MNRRVFVMAFGLFALSGCGVVNEVPKLDEQVNAAWAQVQNQYQRRADLVPNLVETVKGYATQERETLTAVTEARAKATSVQLPKDITENPEAFRKFEEAQGQLSGALGRLLVVSEQYPQLKSDQNFLALQSQLEGTENRIAVSRKDYIEAVRRYNTELRTFPTRLVAAVIYPSAKPKESFTATSTAQEAPKVKF